MYVETCLSQTNFGGAGIVNEQVTKLESKRVKVRVQCKTCGCKFIMRGTPSQDGHIETGFKMCLCNSTDVDVTIIQ